MFKKTTLFAAALALSTTSAFAGGMAPVVDQPPMEETVEPAGSSVSPTYVLLGLLAALVIAAAVAAD